VPGRGRGDLAPGPLGLAGLVLGLLVHHLGAVRAVEGVVDAPVRATVSLANLVGEDAWAGERVRGVAHVIRAEPVDFAAPVAWEAESTSIGTVIHEAGGLGMHVLIRKVGLGTHVARTALGSKVAWMVRVLGSVVTLEVGVALVGLGPGDVGRVSWKRGVHVVGTVRPLVHVALEILALRHHVSLEVDALGSHVSRESGKLRSQLARMRSHLPWKRSHIGRVS